MENKGVLKWRFDVSTFRLIGRDLITDRITALFELVKNCYDANATEVTMSFNNVKIQNPDSSITITDNGIGMSFNDIENKWMVIGTSNKRDTKFSPEPFNRRVVGEKGIGRFAVDKLGDNVAIATTQSGSDELLIVELNGDQYGTSTVQGGQINLFTDVENKYIIKSCSEDSSGTTLDIRNIRDDWSENDIWRLYRELAKMISPAYPMSQPFKIFIKSNEYLSFFHKEIEHEPIKYETYKFELDFSSEKKIQQCLKFNEKNGRIDVVNSSIRSFGGVQLRLYYFNAEAKRVYHRYFKGDDNRIDGVKIYRDGLITTPFAEFEPHPDKKRDILGIDKRRQRAIFDKLGTRDVIGIVNITKDGNPHIIDSTNRQDFIDCSQYRDLKQFIIDQLDEITSLIVYKREQAKLDAEESLQRSQENISQFINAIEEISQKNPEIAEELKNLRKQASEVQTSVDKGIKEYQKAEKDFVRKENIYLSLMSLQDYAKDIAHAVRTSLSSIKDMAEFFYKRYPNVELEDFFKSYSKTIFTEMERLKKVIDFMLSYAGSDVEPEDIRIKDFLTSIFEQFDTSFTKEGIVASVDVVDDFILHSNAQFFADIFQNLISNSKKALEGIDSKRIKCTGYIENDNFILLFSDNGIGIPEENWEQVFELYYTTTADQGGAGIGLFIVKTRINALKGSISVVKSEYTPTGSTFRISFPFNKQQ